MYDPFVMKKAFPVYFLFSSQLIPILIFFSTLKNIVLKFCISFLFFFYSLVLWDTFDGRTKPFYCTRGDRILAVKKLLTSLSFVVVVWGSILCEIFRCEYANKIHC